MNEGTARATASAKEATALGFDVGMGVPCRAVPSVSVDGIGWRKEDVMSKRALIAAGGGAVGAILAAAAFSGAPGGVILAYFAPLPLLLVGLAQGTSFLGMAAAAGIIVCAAISGVAGAAVYAALSALPSWLVVQQALRQRIDPASGDRMWSPIGAIVPTLALVVGFTMVTLALTTAEGEPIEATIRAHLQESFTASLPQMDEAMVTSLVTKVTPLFLGFSAAIWLTMVSVNGILAENILAARGWAMRPRPQWSDFALPDWFAWPLVGTAIIGLAATGDLQYVARNLVIVFAAAYLFQGLATIHTISREVRGRRPLLTTVYILLLAFSIVAVPLVAGLGMIDQWAGIRRRIAGPRGGQE